MPTPSTTLVDKPLLPEVSGYRVGVKESQDIATSQQHANAILNEQEIRSLQELLVQKEEQLVLKDKQLQETVRQFTAEKEENIQATKQKIMELEEKTQELTAVKRENIHLKEAERQLRKWKNSEILSMRKEVADLQQKLVQTQRSLMERERIVANLEESMRAKEVITIEVDLFACNSLPFLKHAELHIATCLILVPLVNTCLILIPLVPSPHTILV